MAAYVVFVALGASIIVAVFQSRSAGAAAVVFGTIFGGFFFVCGIIGIIGWGPDLIAHRPLIWITDEGFEQHVVHPHVFVLCSELADVSLITRSNVTTVAVQVRNPDLLPRRWQTINTALGNPWWAGAVKFCLGTIQVLADVATAPWNIPKDLLGAVSAETALHGSFEIRTAAFPVKAQELAAMLRDRQHNYAVRARAATTSSSASTADADQR